jgi:UDP-glucose 4-epimerase
MGLTVAVTGPTGEIGQSAVDALEREPEVERILGMARRPFDADAAGWTKTEYRQGDILDTDSVDKLVAEADVVVHLAFLIMGSREEAREINLRGTRNVFEASKWSPKTKRLVYTSSVAAYGYHDDNPVPLTEDVPTRGSPEHYYSAQKAECEDVLAEVTADSDLAVYVLRPCVVAGPRATMLADSMPWEQLAELLPPPLRPVASVVGKVRLIPDPGVPMQLVHHDDVAAAIAAASVGRGPAGAYNLAGSGEVSLSDVAQAFGGRAIPVPQAVAKSVSAAVARIPGLPSMTEWVHTSRTSVVMDTAKARRDLGWTPQHSSRETLDELGAAYRARS